MRRSWLSDGTEGRNRWCDNAGYHLWSSRPTQQSANARVLPRAAALMEAMAALVLADNALRYDAIRTANRGG